jgi:malate dehydrogenase (oxaloacetate-decarboxylating)
MTGTTADRRASRSGVEIINTPTLNKGTAFTEEERRELGLQGLLPPHVETLDEQVERAYEAYQREEHDLARHIYLRNLQDTNEVLFYRLVLDHVVEMLPIVYTPVVGQGCQEFSRIYQQSRGLFVSYPHKDNIRTSLRNRPNEEIDVIVVTDGERILGIGDQGVGGLGIPIGKLSLYSLIGGIHPDRTLPIVLDVGTNNKERLDDPEYLGWRHERVTGKDYDDFIAAFVEAVKEELPGVCLQWEDFATPHARPILERYRDQLLTFNDDVQGTASVVLGAVTGAINVSGGALRDQKIVMLGAGSAGIGVADYLRAAMVTDGLTDEQARRQFWVVDKDGLLVDSRTDLQADQAVYAQPASSVSDWPRSATGQIDLPQVVDQVQPTILIGLSTVKGAFTEQIVRAMASHVDRPIIFPLSNPTSHSEATAEDLINWTEGRALVASGSPFLPVTYEGRTIPIGQCNNVYIFPAVGLGLVASGATRVTDLMMVAAGKALGAASPALKDPNAPLLPALTDVRKVAVEIAIAVAKEAQRAGVAPQTSEEELRAKVTATQWAPEYDVVSL